VVLGSLHEPERIQARALGLRLSVWLCARNLLWGRVLTRRSQTGRDGDDKTKLGRQGKVGLFCNNWPERARARTATQTNKPSVRMIQKSSRVSLRPLQTRWPLLPPSECQHWAQIYDWLPCAFCRLISLKPSLLCSNGSMDGLAGIELNWAALSRIKWNGWVEGNKFVFKSGANSSVSGRANLNSFVPKLVDQIRLLRLESPKG